MNLPETIRNAADAITLEDTEGRVEYDNVSFAYDEYVLEGIDFVAEPGETVGLVGPTGAGKTTILKLLLRLYDVENGSVRLDDHDVRMLTVESLRQSMGYVGQENFLFDETVTENIRYGQFDATDEEVHKAAKRAEAHEFITTFRTATRRRLVSAASNSLEDSASASLLPGRYSNAPRS